MKLTFTGIPDGQCSLYQVLTRGISIARLVDPDRKQNGVGAQIRAIPFAVLSVYKGVSLRKG